MIFFIDHFIAPGGVRLRYGFTRPADAVAYVMILQGRGEFIERYDETARELAARNLGCVAFDFRGQGGASREVAQRNMCHVDDINCYCADTFNVVAHVKAHLGLSPSLLLSHSTGSLVGMKMLIDAPSLWQSAVMIAPFFCPGRGERTAEAGGQVPVKRILSPRSEKTVPAGAKTLLSRAAV